MKTADVARSFMKSFRKATGGSFKGQVFAPVDYMPLDNFSTPRRMLRTGADADVDAGTVFLIGTRRYMLAYHSDHETPRLSMKTWRLFEVDQDLSWQRYTAIEDLVTGLPRDTELTDLGTIYAALELPKTESDQLNVPRPKYRLVTNSVIQLGDLVDGKKVTQVWTQLGVWFAEIE